MNHSPSHHETIRTVDMYVHTSILFNIRYGVTANIAAFHAAARGSIPRIGVSFFLRSIEERLKIYVARASVCHWNLACTLTFTSITGRSLKCHTFTFSSISSSYLVLTVSPETPSPPKIVVMSYRLGLQILAALPSCSRSMANKVLPRSIPPPRGMSSSIHHSILRRAPFTLWSRRSEEHTSELQSPGESRMPSSA